MERWLKQGILFALVLPVIVAAALLGLVFASPTGFVIFDNPALWITFIIILSALVGFSVGAWIGVQQDRKMRPRDKL